MLKNPIIKYPKRLLILFVLLLALMIFASTTSAASQPSVKSYIIVMDLNPLIAYEGDIAGMPATKPENEENVDPNSAAAIKYDEFLQETHDDSLEEAGATTDQKVNDYTIALNGYSALLTEEQMREIESQDGVTAVLEDVMRQVDSNKNSIGTLNFTGHSPKLWHPGTYNGEGVIVGVIDSGIWPEHPSFADNGTFPDAPVLDESVYSSCDFGNTVHNPLDAPFECNNKLIGARQMLATYRALIGAEPGEYDSARDDNGHGTHTASTAAGNAHVPAYMYGIPRGFVSGIAPRAQVIAYKGLGNLGGFTSDLASAIDQAVLDGVDVINYSIGGGAGAPSADEIAFLFAADAGVFVATSAGNSGPGPATVGNPGTMPWMTTVGANTQKTPFYQGTIALGDDSGGHWSYWGKHQSQNKCQNAVWGWGWKHHRNNDKCITGASITPGVGESPLIDAEFAGGDLCVPGTLDPALVTGKIVLCRRGVIGRADKSLAVFQAGGVGMIMYENTDDNNLFSDTHWVPTVHIDNTPGLVIKAYIAEKGASATAKIIGGQYGKWNSAPSMTIFSSRGPNPVSPDLIKPDITAPGIQILAGNTPTPIVGVPGELFQAIAGTSMSSPHIAGYFALIKQAHPDWSAAAAKSAIMTTSDQDVVDNDRVSQATPFSMGAGHIDLGHPRVKGSAFQPGLVYDAGLFEYAAYTCGEGFGVFTPGSCAFLEGLGIPSEPYNLNVPSIGISDLPGSQTVVRTVTSVASEPGGRKYRASIDAPDGYTVTVSPSSFTLLPGESATFDVTITNVSAPAGEWRFGSLTWKSGPYDVFSPIAVKGALFSTPSEISGSGTDGSASFNVNFGYTGNYTAAAHGLEAATITSDTVVQDPDQTFDPNDGFSNQHDFNLSGAAFFRIALPPDSVNDPAIDLDVFVYNPSGALVATSTAGGTDELVDIMLPADGTWSVFVHGWQTAGPSSDYDMSTWIISATPGGSLSIDSAPASAISGTTGTIDVSWTGLNPATQYLGAVSHTGDVGLMGLTLVEVDTP